MSRLALVALMFICARPASAWIDPGTVEEERGYYPDGAHVIDGSFVMTVNELHVNITNHGLIGSQFTQALPYSHAPSGQWPAGSGDEYLWAGGLWVGGLINNSVRVSTGQYEREFRPTTDLWSTMYEARDQIQVRPGGNPFASGKRVPDVNADDDHDGRIDEEILNGRDDDLDGAIDEDFGQIGDQMMVCTMYDNTPLAQEVYPDHEPLQLKVVQSSAGFSANDFDDFIVLNYRVTNIGTTDIDSLFVGFLADCDIGSRGDPSLGFDDQTGFFQGAVRASNNSWSMVRVGYMYDGAEDPVPGYFGVMALGRSSFRTYRYFSGNRTYERGGIPIEDEQRFEVMSSGRFAPGFESVEPQDLSFLMSTGHLGVLAPHQTVVFDMAMVMGDGLEDMLENCANAGVAYGGAYFDLDEDPLTGRSGMETKLCFQSPPPNYDEIYKQSAYHMQGSCVGESYLFPLIKPLDFFLDERGLYCIWVNNDNCDECSILTGRDCTNDPYLFWENWNCFNERIPAPQRLGCTGIAGRETRVPWFDTHIPPPSPHSRVWPRDNYVHVFWSDESEYAVDFEVEMVDFESYRVWRADNWARPEGTSTATGPGTDLWRMIAEFDVVDDMVIPIGEGLADTVPLGQNTGLEHIGYRPVCLDDPRFGGLAEAMQAVIDADPDGLLTRLPPLRDRNGVPRPEFAGLLRWESHATVLDTFFMVAERAEAAGVVPKRGVKFYEFIDHEVHNGMLYFYSVTATDRQIKFVDSRPVNRGYGLGGSPNSTFKSVVPATHAQTPEERQREGVNIYVYPNPVTYESLGEFQQFDPGKDDPTGVRIAFANLPEAHNRIRIYTAAGDLIKELHHDGTNGYGQASWNLISDNGQEIVSGIYLYSVEADRDGFENFVGRFVVVR